MYNDFLMQGLLVLLRASHVFRQPFIDRGLLCQHDKNILKTFIFGFHSLYLLYRFEESSYKVQSFIGCTVFAKDKYFICLLLQVQSEPITPHSYFIECVFQTNNYKHSQVLQTLRLLVFPVIRIVSLIRGLVEKRSEAPDFVIRGLVEKYQKLLTS